MTVSFVSTSDNRYVQYRLMSDDWSVNTDDWAIADEGVYVENPEFVYVKTDAEGKILWAIKADGTVYYGAGVPPQVKKYIEQKIKELGLENKTLNLTDVTQADKIQYLSKLFDDLLKRFFIFYGHNLQTINQGSQTNNDELHGYDSISRLIPEIMLKCRQDFCEELNSTFGLNVSVRFNESIQNNIDEDDAQTDLTEAEVEKAQSEATENENPVNPVDNPLQPSNNADNLDNPDNDEDEEKESPESEEKVGDEGKEESEEKEKEDDD